MCINAVFSQLHALRPVNDKSHSAGPLQETSVAPPEEEGDFRARAIEALLRQVDEAVRALVELQTTVPEVPVTGIHLPFFFFQATKGPILQSMVSSRCIDLTNGNDVIGIFTCNRPCDTVVDAALCKNRHGNGVLSTDAPAEFKIEFVGVNGYVYVYV